MDNAQARDASGWEAAVLTAELDGLLLFARDLNINGSVDYWVVQILSSSAEAAKKFHQDAYVDAIEVFKLLDKVFQSVGAEWHPLIKAGTDRLMPEFERVLERDNVGLSLSDLRAMKHLRTSQMAERVGYGQVFALWNPLLSKLVHAIAYSVLVAGKTMESAGLFLVQGVARELRSTVAAIDAYLLANGLPRYHQP